jgi:hypothetical protein
VSWSTVHAHFQFEVSARQEYFVGLREVCSQLHAAGNRFGTGICASLQLLSRTPLRLWFSFLGEFAGGETEAENSHTGTPPSRSRAVLLLAADPSLMQIGLAQTPRNGQVLRNGIIVIWESGFPNHLRIGLLAAVGFFFQMQRHGMVKGRAPTSLYYSLVMPKAPLTKIPVQPTNIVAHPLTRMNMASRYPRDHVMINGQNGAGRPNRGRIPMFELQPFTTGGTGETVPVHLGRVNGRSACWTRS